MRLSRIVFCWWKPRDKNYDGTRYHSFSVVLDIFMEEYTVSKYLLFLQAISQDNSLGYKLMMQFACSEFSGIYFIFLMFLELTRGDHRR